MVDENGYCLAMKVGRQARKVEREMLGGLEGSVLVVWSLDRTDGESGGVVVSRVGSLYILVSPHPYHAR